MTDHLPDDLIVLDCADCRRVMVRPQDAVRGKPYGLAVFACRLAGRPYCRECAEEPPRPTGGGTAATKEDDASPWQANAIRHMEDGNQWTTPRRT